MSDSSNECANLEDHNYLERSELRILVLSFYYRPDLCAGSFRTTALVNALSAICPTGSQINVVTTLPNRYKSFSIEAQESECKGNVSIRRIALPGHKSGMADQSSAFLVFLKGALRYVKSREYDIVFATSSRLMTAVLGAWISSRKKTPLYLDIRDIFVDTMKDVFPGRAARAITPFLSILEKFAITRADRINLVSQGFTGYFSLRYPAKQFSHFTNGIDDEFLAAMPAVSSCEKKNGRIEVVCAGNIGEGQGLHLIVPQLATRLKDRVHFTIIGDGGRRQALQDAVTMAKIDNVTLLPPMQRDSLIRAYRSADVLFAHLNDYEAFKKVLPSKLFEYAAVGKPIWAGLEGFSAEFVAREITNAVVFPPCNAEAAEEALSHLLLRDTHRTAFVEKYTRSNISKLIAADIMSVAWNGDNKCAS
jgi:glycosyltransferase involved in cell wall biosynthesis